MNTQWSEWVRRTTGGASSRDIAQRIGKSHTTVLRWMHDGVPPRAAILIAIAFKADVMTALVAAGTLREEDLRKINMKESLGRVSTPTLTAEIHRRAVATAKHSHR